MPIYEYHCMDCGNTYEEIRNIEGRDVGLICPRCHSTNVERILSVFSAVGGTPDNACDLTPSGHG